MKNLSNYKINKKNIIFRADLNVPLIDGKISDKSRIDSIKSSIKKLIKQKNKIFICSHFGRPKGKVNNKYSLRFICPFLQKNLGVKKIHFLKKLDNISIKKQINKMSYGEICLIENIRFFKEEETNDLKFSKNITSNFDVYVNDAFSASHRKHASIVGFANYLPAVAGDSLIKEIKNIDLFINNLKKPNIVILGGSKISTKLNLLNIMVEMFQTVVIGGAMANTFLLSNNISVGKSLVEKDLVKEANKIQIKAKKLKCNIILPVDVICSKNIKDKKNIKSFDIENITNNQMILDIGKKTIKVINKEILKSKMLLWNGPVGVFEIKPFDKGTRSIANIINKYSKNHQIFTIAGGGDTISAIKSAKAESGFNYISNAGGAFLEWLERKKSPGVKAIIENVY